MDVLTIEAVIENLGKVFSFVNRQLETADCSRKLIRQIDLSVEEIYINIASYAYSPGTGNVTICCTLQEAPPQITLVFQDAGKPYNPLTREDPNVALPAKEREIGGLGVFLVKKVMDTASYCFQDGKNVLTITKRLQ